MNFYQALSFLCCTKGISISKMCEEIGLSNATATQWKKGAKPSEKTLKLLADFFGESVEDFCGRIVTYEWIIEVKGMENEVKDDINHNPEMQKRQENTIKLIQAIKKAPNNVKKAIADLLEIDFDIDTTI